MKLTSPTTTDSTNTLPRVSIVCISYNQEDYIAQAIEGFLIQKTNFSIEIIISDDASTDKTADIIREYEKKNPGLFRTNLRTKNVGVKVNITEALKSATGDFVALCEGDDFWTDPLKLQKQVDFLDTHKDHSLVFHPVRVFFENHEEEDSIFPEVTDNEEFPLERLLKGNFIQTNSVMYRRIGYDQLSQDVMPFDWYLHLTHARNGKIGFINQVMSAYRRHAGGIWWETTSKGRDEVWKRHGAGHLVLYVELLKMYGDKVKTRQIIDEHIEGTINILSRIDKSEKMNLIGEFVEKFPELNGMVVLSLARVTYKNYKQLEKNNKPLKKLESELRTVVARVENLEREKEEIINSKAYRIGGKLARISRTIRRKK
ncbi:MAG: sugar transferase [Candidatus Saccharibacteria bacterium]|nr:sugar transferase [Candidatus Saccharibacteria bacterium]